MRGKKGRPKKGEGRAVRPLSLTELKMEWAQAAESGMQETKEIISKLQGRKNFY